MIKLIRYDGGRANSKRPLQHSDCSVISIAIATGLSYDFVFDMMAYFAKRKSNDGVYDKDLLKVWRMFAKIRIIKPAKNIIAAEAIINYCRRGTYIISTDNHVFCVKNGRAYDCQMTRFDLLTSSVYAIYKFNKY